MDKGIKDEIREKSLAIVIRALSIDLDNNSDSLFLTIEQLVNKEIEAIDIKLSNMDPHLSYPLAVYKNVIKKMIKEVITKRRESLQNYIDNVTLENNKLTEYVDRIDEQATNDKKVINTGLSNLISSIIKKQQFNQRAKRYVLTSFSPSFLDKINIAFKNRNETLKNNSATNLGKLNVIRNKVLKKEVKKEII